MSGAARPPCRAFHTAWTWGTFGSDVASATRTSSGDEPLPMARPRMENGQPDGAATFLRENSDRNSPRAGRSVDGGFAVGVFACSGIARFSATANHGTKGARTQRTLVRGTAKRLLQQVRQAAPNGALARSVAVTGLENSRFSDQPVAEATLKIVVVLHKH